MGVNLRMDTLIWDGDDYKSDSFTFIIAKVLERMPNLRLAIFLRDRPEDKSRVQATWFPIGVKLVCYLCPSDVDFDELGVIGLAASKSKTVVCLGGASIVGAEFDRAPQDVTFYYFPMTRYQPDGTFERSVLDCRTAPNLRLINCIFTQTVAP